MKIKFIIIGLVLINNLCVAQTFTEKIAKELAFNTSNNEKTVMVANINGSIKVVGYAGDKILLEVEKTVKAKSQEQLEQGKQSIQLGILNIEDTLILYVDGTCNHFEKRKRHNENSNEGWGYSWQNSNTNECQENFEYELNYVIKVPLNVNLNLSTINDGNIEVNNVGGKIHTNNINGSITLVDLTQQAIAHTINGDVDVRYNVNPINDCKFYTLNGNINATVQKGLAASLSFESFNGSFYTNIDKVKMLPALLEQSKTGEGIKYKINGNRYQVGKGGVHLDFETFNGNVYLKEKIN